MDRHPLNLAEWEAAARRVLDTGAFDYVTGGAADEITLAENRAAFERLRLLPRVLRGVDRCAPATTVLGRAVRAPVMVAPMAYQGVLHPDGDLNTARACAALGLGMCLSSLSNHALEDVAGTAPGAVRWYQLYPYADGGMTRAVVDAAREHAYDALVITVDVPVPAVRERDRRSGFAIPAHLGLPSVPTPAGRGPITPDEVGGLMKADLGWADIEAFAERSGMPVVVKGILAPDDAARAVDAGARGVVVSNHGGRQLDTAIATIDALPAVVDAVGADIEVYLDSGVRRGTDVLKALALGARAVLVGRPVAWANGAAGEEGVRTVLRQLVAEFETSMALGGCADVGEIGPRLLVA